MILFSQFLFAQQLTTQNKKAIRYYEKASDELKKRDFQGAISNLERAVRKDDGFAEAYLRLAHIYNILREKDSILLYYNKYADVTPPEKINNGLLLKITRMNFESGGYRRAEALLDRVSSSALSPEQEHEFALLSASVALAIKESATDKALNITTLPPAINRFELQYFPVLTVDEQTMFFTRIGPRQDEDIVVSYKSGNEWQPAVSVSSTINSEFNEGACTISADGRILIFTSCEGRKSYGSCDLYICFREGDHWSTPENMGLAVNSTGWESQPSLSADGNVLYFSSNRNGGLGKRDLWVSSFDGKEWSAPENLGSKINTASDELTPFIHANNRSLFFSSDGHPGLGGIDLYLVERGDSLWQDPVNLGATVNSYDDEVGLFVTADGKTGYFSKEISSNGKTLESKLVKFDFPSDTLIESKASYVTGRVLNAENGAPIKASFQMVDLNDEVSSYQVSSDPVTGRYFLVLNEGREYGVFISKQNYLFEDLKFVAGRNTILEPDTVDIYLHPIRQGQSIILENIYFAFNEATLDKKSKSELQEIVRFLENNPAVKVQIEGHTDNIGNERYNQQLSEQRARAVVDYLIRQGIDKIRLDDKGFGASRPITSNETEAGRQTNRRIEFRIIQIR